MVTVVTTQPDAMKNEWSSALCSVCEDLPICLLGCICPLVLRCYLSDLYGENLLTALVPGGLTALRTHIRLSYGIKGSVCNDALMVCCCGLFEACRMTREVRKHNR